MQALLLRPEWPTSFRRAVRDKEGAVMRTILFERGKPLILNAEDYAIVEADIGKAIVPAATDEKGQPTAKAARESKSKGKRKKE